METHPVREAGSRCPLGDEEVGGDGDVIMRWEVMEMRDAMRR